MAELTTRFGGTWLMMLIASVPAWANPTTIIDNGAPSNRVDIVFLGDGYTQSDLDIGTYDRHIQGFLDHMFVGAGFLADPFPRYQKFFNAHKISVVSQESGADIPSQEVFVDTRLNAAYESSGIERLLTISSSAADSIRYRNLLGTEITADMQLAVVNHSKYGGSGGSWAVYAGGNGSAREIALHELGHSFSDLADEYVSYEGSYPDPEPSERNVTKSSRGAKWNHWLNFDDPRDSNLDIGVYAGADYYPTGVYRPSFDSKMRSLNRPFDAVSREAIIHDIYEHVDPLDAWLENHAPLVDTELWVDVVDTDVIRLEWYVDDLLVEGATGEAFDLDDYGYGPGTYEVRAHAYDEVIDHALSGDLLDLVRTRFDLLQQDIEWLVTLSAPLVGDYNFDQVVDALDFGIWNTYFGSTSELDADGNGDGIIDGADYTVWRDNVGAVAEMTTSGASRAVPEAGSAVLAIAGMLAGALHGRVRCVITKTSK